MRIDLPLAVDVEFDLDIKRVVFVDLMRVKSFTHGCYINIISHLQLTSDPESWNSFEQFLLNQQIINEAPAEIAFDRFGSKVSYFQVP